MCEGPAVNASTAALSTGHHSRQHLREIEKVCGCMCVSACGWKGLLYEKVMGGERG